MKHLEYEDIKQVKSDQDNRRLDSGFLFKYAYMLENDIVAHKQFSFKKKTIFW